MTYAIRVPTPFQDISELAENFAPRVDDERLMLPHSEAIPEGEWVQFEVSLGDASPALSGMGRCTGAYDNGEDRAPEHRYDVVLDNLQLEEMAQIYFDRILQVRAGQTGEGPATGQIEAPPDYGDEDPSEQVEASDLETAAAAEAVPADGDAPRYEDGAVEDDSFEADVTQAVSMDELDPAARDALAAEPYPQEAAAELNVPSAPDDAHAVAPIDELAEAQPQEAYAEAPQDHDELQDTESLATQPAEEIAEEIVDERPGDGRSIEAPTELRIPSETAIYELPPPSPPEALPSPHASNGQVLTRPALAASWSPEPVPRPEPMPSSGLFQQAVGAGLPIPAEPPRPHLDPSLRVSPAPRPGDPHTAPAVITAAASSESAEPVGAESQPAEALDDAQMEPLSLPPEEAEHANMAGGFAENVDDVVALSDSDNPPNVELEHEVDFTDLEERDAIEGGDETSSVEIPDDDDERA